MVLIITYLAEALTTTFSIFRKPNSAFQHYCEIFSGVCWKNEDHFRNKILVYAYGFILPLFQQTTSLIYLHWTRSFVEYWEEKKKFTISDKSGEKLKTVNCKICKVVMYSGSKSRGRVRFGVCFLGSGRVWGSTFRERLPRVFGFFKDKI